jgi:hypothetical protein
MHGGHDVMPVAGVQLSCEREEQDQVEKLQGLS